MDLQLSGKVALVTGASRGIGRAIARALASEGAGLALVARGRGPAREAEREIAALGVPSGAIAADVTRHDDVERMFRDAVRQLGGVDILVNNAGGSFPDDDDGWEQAFRINIDAAARATRSVVPFMRERGGGVIVHIASIYGREAGGGLPYNAMKAAMISHARTPRSPRARQHPCQRCGARVYPLSGRLVGPPGGG